MSRWNHQWMRTILEDEFSDASQNQVRNDDPTRAPFGTGPVGGYDVIQALLALAPIMPATLDVGCGGGEMEFDLLLEPCGARAKSNPKILMGWAEDIPLEDSSIGYILCWDTMFFVRSTVEVLLEFSRILCLGGTVILDVCLHTTQPNVQTVDGESFRRWVCLFGFEVVGYMEFGPDWNRRLGLRLKKIRQFDPAYFRLPQCQGGRIANFLPERDSTLQ